MYAIEFETVIKNRYIELRNADELLDKHVRIIVLVDENKCNVGETDDNNRINLINKVFDSAVNYKIDDNIDIDKICNEVNG